MPAESKVCMPAVTALVAHLKTTGTGQAKLDKLTELGKICSSLDQFLEMAPNNVPAITMGKIDEYITSQVSDSELTPEKKAKKVADSWGNTVRGKSLKDKAIVAAKKEAEEPAKPGEGLPVTETRSSTQSSIPDHTVLIENKAPVLKEGNKDAKKLGADVEVDAEGDIEGEEDSTPDASEVANLNVGDATDKISRMQSQEKLQHIVDTDTRKTVKEAATKRLEELIAAE